MLSAHMQMGSATTRYQTDKWWLFRHKGWHVVAQCICSHNTTQDSSPVCSELCHPLPQQEAAQEEGYRLTNLC